MALIQPTLADPISPDEFQRQAAERVTPLSEYLGAKALGGLEAARPVEAFELGSLPSRYAADEYGLMPPGPPPADLMSKEQFDASPHARPGLEWEEGETEARAAARAAVHDRQAYRDSLVARSDAGPLAQAAGFGLGLGTAALDPTNYIPLIGPASRAAMVARFGRIGGALLMHGTEAAANTALFEPLAAEAARAQGRGYGWEEAGADILVNALGGAVLGTAVGEGARALGFGHGAAPEATVPDAGNVGAGEAIISRVRDVGAGVVPRRSGTPPLRVDDLMRRADGANLALDQIDRGEPVDVGKVLANDPAVRAPPPLPPGLDAYHGTPHLFDEFSGEKINTGEGAQAFGHGLYFAENRDTAEMYRRNVTQIHKGSLLGEPGAADRAATAADLLNADVPRNDVDNALQALEPAATAEQRAAWIKEGEARVQQLRDVGHLYKVRLAMEHGDLLDWDKPLSEQTPKVREALAALGITDNGLTGKLAYRQLVKKTIIAALEVDNGAGKPGSYAHKGPPGASRALAEAGIPGIRYLDAGSRDAAEGTRNIVVFDPARIHLLERNGMSLATATPEPPHPSVAEAAPRVGKAADELATFKEDAKLEGYQAPLPGHEPKPEPGSADAAKAENAKPGIPPTPKEQAVASAALPPELQEVEAMRREGTLTPADDATLAAGEKEAQQAEGYATAYETLLNCVLRNV